MKRPLVVLKVGGSLLDWPELPRKLAALLESRRDQRLLLIAGGGRFADVLRDLDQTHRLGEEPSHALALRVLDVTAHLLAGLLPGSRVIEDVSQLFEVWSSREIPILAPRLFLEADDRSPDPLPHAWTTTTDAIAARLAVRLEAAELILLKSLTTSETIGLEEAATLGIVDPEFPRAASGLALVTFQNLREVSGRSPKGTDPRST
jgi:aspartokinase-like uncharacterized kinase